MEDFAQSLPQSAIKARLLDALARPKPFRRFKEIVFENKTLRDHWHRFHEDALAEYMMEWLAGEEIEAELVRPRGG